MPPGKNELSITINQCLLLDRRFELESIKIPFLKNFSVGEIRDHTASSKYEFT